MLSKTIQQSLNDQIANEFYAAHLYLSMSAYFEHQNLPGFAHWMRLQNQEEVSHAMRIFNFVVHNGGRVVLKGLDEPPSEFKGALEVMQAALKHEQGVTQDIHRIYEQAMKEKQYATQLEMEWFVTEQVEEERTVEEIIARLEMAGTSVPALLMIDREVGARASAG